MHRQSLITINYFVTGTRRFSSSNQLRTTWICGAAGAPDGVWPDATCQTILPSGMMSFLLGTAPLAGIDVTGRGTGTGLLKVKVGCVETLTASNPPALGM